MVTALVLLFPLRAAEADQRVRTDLLADLLASTGRRGGADPAPGRPLGRARPAARAAAAGPARAGGVPHRAGGRAGCCWPRPRAPDAGWPGEHGGSVVGLVPGRDPPRWPRAGPAGCAPRTCRAGGRGRAGRSPLRGLRDAHAEAARLHGRALARSACRPRRHADLGFAGLVPGTPPDVDGYLERVLGPVAAHDARRGSDLVATLEAYFACGASPRRAAGALHVHVNTVAQRLERVAALLGADWQPPDRALEIQLALRLRRLRRPRERVAVLSTAAHSQARVLDRGKEIDLPCLWPSVTRRSRRVPDRQVEGAVRRANAHRVPGLPSGDRRPRPGRHVRRPFKPERMTWIKPSFLWMMYRCGWAQAGPGARSGDRVCGTNSSGRWPNACLSDFRPDCTTPVKRGASGCAPSPVRVQWDPEREPRLDAAVADDPGRAGRAEP